MRKNLSAILFFTVLVTGVQGQEMSNDTVSFESQEYLNLNQTYELADRGQDSVMDKMTESKSRELYYLGIGGGLGKPGGSIGIQGTYVSSSGFGMTLAWKFIHWEHKDMPDDYDGVTKPLDNIRSTSISLIYQSAGNFRWGIEFGPGLIRYHEAYFVPVTRKRCWPESLGGNCYKYDSYDTEYQTAAHGALTIRAKWDFGKARKIGGEFAALAIINKYKPIFGFELYLNLGRVNRN